jgi:uridine phosphorylase
MKASELVLAPDGTLYHIRLQSSTLADKVLLVGDPGRVNMFKEIFDSVEFESQNREIHALTGTYHGTRLTALSTGMGCDNIDIVLTELDAALRVENGEWHEDCDRHLQLVRIGTSGSLQADIDCGSVVASAYAIGLDGLMNYSQFHADAYCPTCGWRIEFQGTKAAEAKTKTEEAIRKARERTIAKARKAFARRADG